MADEKKQDDEQQKPGPDEERLNIDEDWEEAAKKMAQKKRPKDGWPKSDDSQQDD